MSEQVPTKDQLSAEMRLTWRHRLLWGTVGGIIGSVIYRLLEALVR